MAFSAIGSLVPYGGPVLRSQIVTGSVTLTVMDSVKLVSGFVSLGTAGVVVLGHVSGIRTNLGSGMQSTGVAGASFGSFVGTFLTASDNTTVAMVRAEVDVSQFTLYSAELDNTIATTTGSNLAGYRMDLADEDTLDEDTATTSTAQYGTWGVDPSNSAQAVVNILESIVFNT
ncbi:MAG: hypothetical protein NUW00_05725 [Candidatus Kaiserbacteria bacterium]|nr:hypothetical protein [Candidatus Kaiserbacteria bacterium]